MVVKTLRFRDVEVPVPGFGAMVIPSTLVLVEILDTTGLD